MSYATANDLPVHAISIVWPRVGRWFAECALSGGELVAGDAVTVRLGETVTLRGTVERGGRVDDLTRVRIVGGAGGLGRDVDAASYAAGVPLSVCVGDLLRATGETLYAVSSDVTLRRWERPQGRAGRALTGLCALAGQVWRMTDDGTVWIGTDAWADTTLPLDELSRDDGRGIVTYGDEAIALRPGVSVEGRHVHEVTADVTPDGVRVHARVESDGWGLLARVVRRVGPDVEAHALWPGTVVAQSSDLSTVDVRMDSQALAPAGLSAVPIRLGVPGVAVKVTIGARVLVCFEGGDRRYPIATIWDSATVQEIKVTATTKATIVAPDVRIGSASASDGVVTQTRLNAMLTAIQSWMSTHVHTGVTTGTGASGSGESATTPAASITATGSTTVRATP